MVGRNSTVNGYSRRAGRRPRASGAAPARVSAPSGYHYRLVFEHDLIGMYRTTLEGRILDCNASMARMLGYRSRAELLRHRATELYHSPADRADFLRCLRRTGLLTGFECHLRRKDGGSVVVLENVTLVPGRRGQPTTIQGTMVDITERQRAEQALRASESRYRTLSEELRRLARHAETVREAERARIARELHDELGQSLTALALDLHWLRDRTTAELRERADSLSVLVGDTIQRLRRICTDLRPAVLDDLGLPAAIEWQAREFQARTGVRVHVALTDVAPRLLPEQATAVFRILQESLTNVARHARATQVRVALRVRAGALTLHVRDNGIGIAPERAAASGSLGLLGMRERALHWQGTLDVAGKPGRGTTVTLRMPIASKVLT